MVNEFKFESDSESAKKANIEINPIKLNIDKKYVSLVNIN